MSDRGVRFTIFDPARRFLRRGYWSQWELELVERVEALEFAEPIARGWTRRSKGSRFVQFDIGTESDVSQRVASVRAGTA